MSAGGHILRNRTVLRSGVNMDILTVPGVYALEAPTNSPDSGDYLVEVYVALDGATRIIAQRSTSLTDGSTSMRLYDGIAWGEHAAIGGASGSGGTRVRAATTANIANIGAALNGSPPGSDSIDDVLLALGDLVLVKNQNDNTENGIYEVGPATKVAGYDEAADYPGILVVVTEGTENADTLWLCTTNAGSSAIVFVERAMIAAIAGGLTLDAGTLRVNESIVVAVGDEETELTTGDAKVTFRMPYAFTLTGVRGSLGVASTAGGNGAVNVDVRESGTTIFSTPLTIDQDEKTSLTANAAVVISDTALADDAEIKIDIDVAGTGAKGLKLVFLGYRP